MRLTNSSFNLQHLGLSSFFPIITFSWSNLLAWSTDSWQVNSFTSRHLDRNAITEFFSYLSFCISPQIYAASWHCNILPKQMWWVVVGKEQWSSGSLDFWQCIIFCWSMLTFTSSAGKTHGLWKAFHSWYIGIFVKFHYLKSSWGKLTSASRSLLERKPVLGQSMYGL